MAPSHNSSYLFSFSPPRLLFLQKTLFVLLERRTAKLSSDTRAYSTFIFLMIIIWKLKQIRSSFCSKLKSLFNNSIRIFMTLMIFQSKYSYYYYLSNRKSQLDSARQEAERILSERKKVEVIIVVEIDHLVSSICVFILINLFSFSWLIIHFVNLVITINLHSTFWQGGSREDGTKSSNVSTNHYESLGSTGTESSSQVTTSKEEV